MSNIDSSGLTLCPDGIIRCWWAADHEAHFTYHDGEWGVPVTDTKALFEKLSLESFQSGLSWLTILLKRENFRDAFHQFSIEKVASMTEQDVDRLLRNEGIVRHAGKINATINNAQALQALLKEHDSFHAYIQSFVEQDDSRPETMTYDVVKNLGASLAAHALSKDLKKRGFKFVGPTTVYAFLQAAGFVNDHVKGCPAGDALRS